MATQKRKALLSSTAVIAIVIAMMFMAMLPIMPSGGAEESQSGQSKRQAFHKSILITKS